MGRISALVCLCSLCVGFGQVNPPPSDELVIPVAVTGISQNPNLQFYFTIHHLVSRSFPDRICTDGFTNTGGPLNIASITPTSSVCLDARNIHPGTLITPSYFSASTAGRTFAGVIENGWVRLRIFGSGRVEALNEIGIADRLNQTINVFMLPAVRAAREFDTAAVWSSSGGLSRGSSYAIVNPSETQTATVQLSLKIVGSFSCEKQVKIPPLNRVSQFLDELLSPCRFAEESFGGTLRVRSNVPIAVAALTTQRGRTITLPVTRLESAP